MLIDHYMDITPKSQKNVELIIRFKKKKKKKNKTLEFNI